MPAPPPPIRERPAERHPVVEVLKGRRIAMGLSQRQLAVLVGVRQAEISAWEIGRKHPTTRNVSRWAAALGCELIIVERETPDDHQPG